jgi:hypothetical protein
VISLLALLWWVLFAPDGLRDGQLVLIFYLFTIPFGALLGVVAGVAGVLLQWHARETAGWMCLGGGSLIAMLAVVYSFVWPGIRSPFGLTHPAYGSPLVWAVVEMIWGLAVLWRQ